MKYTHWIALPLAITLAVTPALATEREDFDDLVQLVNRYSLFTAEESLPDSLLAPYWQQLDAGTLTATDAIELVLEEFDPYGHYFPASDYTTAYSNLEGFIGIGITYNQTDDGQFLIVKLTHEAPAARAGLQVGDYLTHIDQQPLQGLTSDQVKSLILGEEDTTVAITYTRAGQSYTVEVSRETVYETVLTTYDLAEDITYVGVSGFTNTADINEFVGDWIAQDPADAPAVVLDLRDNGGGLVEDALLLANAFVDQRKVLLCTERVREKDTHMYSNGEGVAPRDLVILVNEGTASAAELLAGALADATDAILIGEDTYGKGLGQQHLLLENQDRMVLTVMALILPERGLWDGEGLAVAYDAANPRDLRDLFATYPIDTQTPLAVGKTGASVYALSIWLSALGYLEQPTKTVDATLLSATQAFCAGQGLPLPTTQIDTTTLQRLYAVGMTCADQGYFIDQGMELALELLG